MPEEKAIPEFKLVYINGQEHGAPPVFKDVRLIRDTQNYCAQLEARARSYDRRLTGPADVKRCVEVYTEVSDATLALEELRKEERRPWDRIIKQLESSVNSFLMSFPILAASLKQRIANWNSEENEGRKRQQEKLIREAQQEEVKSKIDSNPVVRRQAEVRAKQKLEEAQAWGHKPAVGAIEVEYYEPEIENRALAAKLPEEAVRMEVNSDWFKRKIAEARKAKLPLPTWPGIKLVRKTYVRVAK